MAAVSTSGTSPLLASRRLSDSEGSASSPASSTTATIGSSMQVSPASGFPSALPSLAPSPQISFGAAHLGFPVPEGIAGAGVAGNGAMYAVAVPRPWHLQRWLKPRDGGNGVIYADATFFKSPKYERLAWQLVRIAAFAATVFLIVVGVFQGKLSWKVALPGNIVSSMALSLSKERLGQIHTEAELKALKENCLQLNSDAKLEKFKELVGSHSVDELRYLFEFEQQNAPVDETLFKELAITYLNTRDSENPAPKNFARQLQEARLISPEEMREVLHHGWLLSEKERRLAVLEGALARGHLQIQLLDAQRRAQAQAPVAASAVAAPTAVPAERKD